MARVKVKVPIEQLAAEHVARTANVTAPLAELAQPKKQFTIPRKSVYAVVIVLVVAGFVIFTRKHDPSAVQGVSTMSSNLGEAQQLQSEVGELVELPAGQTPIVKPVTQALISENTFLSHAKEGDTLLLYVAADKSVFYVIYRSSSKKIIEASNNATYNTTQSTPGHAQTNP